MTKTEIQKNYIPEHQRVQKSQELVSLILKTYHAFCSQTHEITPILADSLTIDSPQLASMVIQMFRLVTSDPNRYQPADLNNLLQIAKMTNQLEIEWQRNLLLNNLGLAFSVHSIEAPIGFLRILRERIENIDTFIVQKVLYKAANRILPEIQFPQSQNSLKNALKGWSRQRLSLSVLKMNTLQDLFLPSKEKGWDTLQTVLAEILLKPFESQERNKLLAEIQLANDMHLLRKSETAISSLHPLQILQIADQILSDSSLKDNTLLLFSEAANAYRQVVSDHMLLVSAINSISSPWRAYARLNLDSIKKARKQENNGVINAVSFDETRTVLMNFNGTEYSKIVDLVLQGIADALVYHHHDWIVPDGENVSPLNYWLKSKGISKLFCSYNRAARDPNQEHQLYPQEGYIVCAESAGECSLEFKIKHGLLGTLDQSNLRDLYQLIQKQQNNRAIQLCSEFLQLDTKRAKWLVRQLSTLPVVIVREKEIPPTKPKSTLHHDTMEDASVQRRRFVTANLVMVVHILSNRIIYSINTNHDPWDGAHTQEFLRKMVVDISDSIVKMRPVIQTDGAPNNGTEVEFSIFTQNNGSASGVFPPERAIDNKEPYHPIQGDVEVTGLFFATNRVAAIARKLKKEGQLPTSSKLSSPAFVLELAILSEYQRILTELHIIDPHDSIGILLGDNQIDSDLNLGRFTNGFDIKEFQKVPEEKQKVLLLILDEQVRRAVRLSNIDRLIAPIVQLLPEPAHKPINGLSRLLKNGLQWVQGPALLSAFKLPQFSEKGRLIISGNSTKIAVDAFLHQQSLEGLHAAGPALTESQTVALTLNHAVCSISDKGFLERMKLSFRIKARNNLVAVSVATSLLHYIQSFNNQST